MKKLLKIIVLIGVLFIANHSFAGGWQKLIDNPNIGYNGSSDNYLPTKDGGVIIYATRTNDYQNQGLISNFSSDFIVTRFDKYGNIVFKKIINKYSIVFSGDTIAYKYYRTSIFDIIELIDGNFLAISGGPILDTSAPAISKLDYSKSTMFTIFDKFGNILYNKFNEEDTIVGDFNSTTKIRYDKENAKYNLYLTDFDTTHREYKLKIKTYDTLLVSKLVKTMHFSAFCFSF